jgi:hypothetical protein
MADPIRFRVNSGASTAVIAVALVPAIALLCLAFALVFKGDAVLGAVCAAGFLGVIIPAGLMARRLGCEIEVSDLAVRRLHSSGKVIEIQWAEPHRIEVKKVRLGRSGIAAQETTQLHVRAQDRTISFTAITGGAIGAGMRLAKNNEIAAAARGVARALELGRT